MYYSDELAIVQVSSKKAIKALFKSKKFLDFDTVTLSFLFDKHYPIIE